MVCFSAPQSHSGKFLTPYLCKESARLPCKVRIILSAHNRFRCRSDSVSIFPGDMLPRMLSFSTVAAHVCFQFINISKFVLIRSLAYFDGSSRLQLSFGRTIDKIINGQFVIEINF